jgi:hypothetical protein
MDQTNIDPRTELVQTSLELARSALKTNNLEEAQNHYREALSVPGHHPRREDDIRQNLKTSSDDQIRQIPPEWGAAQRLLDMLDGLGLGNDDTRAWKRDLKLKQGHDLLDKGKHRESFEIFKHLIIDAEPSPAIQERLRADISQMVRDYMRQQAVQHHWPLLCQAVESLQNAWAVIGELQDWPETTTHIVIEMDQSLRRARNFGYILLSIFIITALGYICVLIQVL